MHALFTIFYKIIKMTLEIMHDELIRNIQLRTYCITHIRLFIKSIFIRYQFLFIFYIIYNFISINSHVFLVS